MGAGHRAAGSTSSNTAAPHRHPLIWGPATHTDFWASEVSGGAHAGADACGLSMKEGGGAPLLGGELRVCMRLPASGCAMEGVELRLDGEVRAAEAAEAGGPLLRHQARERRDALHELLRSGA